MVFPGRGQGRPWQHEEILAALKKAVENRSSAQPPFRVIPVVLPGASEQTPGDIRGFISLRTLVDFRPRGIDDAEAFAQLSPGSGRRARQAERPTAVGHHPRHPRRRTPDGGGHGGHPVRRRSCIGHPDPRRGRTGRQASHGDGQAASPHRHGRDDPGRRHAPQPARVLRSRSRVGPQDGSLRGVRPAAAARTHVEPSERVLRDRRRQSSRAARAGRRGHRGGRQAGGPVGLRDRRARRPCGVAASMDCVYVADTFNHRVQVLTRDLRALSPRHARSRTGQFAYPVGVAAWHEWILVAESTTSACSCGAGRDGVPE